MPPVDPALRAGGDADAPARRGAGLLLASGVWLGAALVYFRAVWTGGFDRLMGVETDTKLVAYLCEHWFQVLHGQASWRNPSFYYPVKDLLGWSDVFFLYQAFYAPLREIGCGPELALQLTLIILSGIGFVTFYWLAVELFRAPAPVALAGALVFCFANNLYLHVDAPQLSGLYLVPPIALVARRAWTARIGSPRRAAAFGAAAGALYGLLFFTTFYVALFVSLAAIVAAVWASLLHLLPTSRARNAGGDGFRSLAWLGPVGGGALGFLAGVVPFALTYWPVHSARGGVTAPQVLTFSENWRALFGVGAGNVLWGAALHPLEAGTPVGLYRSEYGLTPALLLATIIGSVWAAWHMRTEGGDRIRIRSGLVLALSALTLMLLPVRIDGRPPWLLLRRLPGFDAIRAIDRLGVMAGALASLALVALASELWDRSRLLGSPQASRPAVRRACLAGALALIVAEQLNTADVGRLYRAADSRLMAAVPPPPASCRWFYVVDTAQVDRLNATLPFFDLGSPVAQVDAMLIAQRYRIATLNGYTGGAPSGWHLDPIGGAAYEAAVRQWVESRRPGPSGCRLDLDAKSWAENQ